MCRIREKIEMSILKLTLIYCTSVLWARKDLTLRGPPEVPHLHTMTAPASPAGLNTVFSEGLGTLADSKVVTVLSL